MTNFEANKGAARGDLLQRVALMETMIAEGRRTTTRYGWIFLMWGVMYFVAMGWMTFLPFQKLAWPVCVAACGLIVVMVKWREKRGRAVENLRSRSIEAVWIVMGIAASLFLIAAIAGHHGGDTAFAAAMMFMVGMAHGTSALILRWAVQGLATAIWWGCGIAMLFFTSPMVIDGLFLAASFFGMIMFGLYAMMLERRHSPGPVQSHA